MDFSKLTQEKLNEYILFNGNLPSGDLVNQATNIFNKRNNVVTLPVADLYLASLFNGPKRYYAERIIKNINYD